MLIIIVIKIKTRIEFTENKQNDIKIDINNQEEINNSNNLPPASPFGEFDKSAERFNNENKNYLTINVQNNFHYYFNII